MVVTETTSKVYTFKPTCPKCGSPEFWLRPDGEPVTHRHIPNPRWSQVTKEATDGK